MPGSNASLHALITAYRDPEKSPEWAGLKPRTQKDYQRVFDWLQPIGEMPLVTFDTPFVYALRDKAFKKHKRRFANYVVQVLRLLFSWGMARRFIPANPAVGVAKIPRPKSMPKANRAWSDEERETVLREAPIELRVVTALGMFAALREDDACQQKKSAFDGKLIETVAAKNGEPLWLPAHFRLKEILADAAQARREGLFKKAKKRKVIPIDPPSLTVNRWGKTWTTAGFRSSFFKLIGRLEREGKVNPGLTFHGLRHTVGKLVMEAGGSKTDVGLLLGDRSEAMATLYSQEHEKKQRVSATIRRLERTERKKMENSRRKSGKL
ncbi:MAG: tyrosine-type recombinase/integrase [Rhizomicrobium sp.]